MLPLRDNNPTNSFPILTILLIVVNIYIFFTQPPDIAAYYAMIPAKIVTNHNFIGVVHVNPDGSQHLHQVQPNSMVRIGHNDIPVGSSPEPLLLTIFTAMFLHANFMHLAGNMLFLWIFGNNVEDALGKIRFLLFYFACGLAAAIAQIAVGPLSLIPTLGASGAIAGVMAAYIVMYPGAKVLTWFPPIFFFEISAFWVIGVWIVMNIIQGVNGLGGMATGGVAYFAHIGGYFAGLFLTLALGGRKLGDAQLRLRRYSRSSY